MRYFFKTILFLLVLFVSIPYSFAAADDADSIALLQKIEQLSKTNKSLKQRISTELRKQDAILTRISKLTSNVELKAEINAQQNTQDSINAADFEYVDDNLLRKCKSVTSDLYKKQNLQEQQFNKDTFESEEFDAEWTSEVSASINQQVSSRFPDTEIVSIDCRTTICEINLKHQNEAAGVDFGYNFILDIKWDIIGSQGEKDVITNGSIVSIQITR